MVSPDNAERPKKSLIDYAGGDPRMAKILESNVKRFAEKAKDPANKELLTDVLAGKADLRDVVLSKAFNAKYGRIATKRIGAFMEMPAEERKQVVEEARRQLDRQFGADGTGSGE